MCLPSESSNETGYLNLERTPYLREPFDCLSDSKTRKIVLKTSAQVGKTTFMCASIAWVVKNDPSPIIFVQPTLDMAKQYSKIRIEPLFAKSPSLQNSFFDDGKSRTEKNTMLFKMFSGGHLSFVGSNSETGLSGKSIKYVFGDELSKWDARGVALVEKRTTTFPNSKVFYASTPNLKNDCPVSDEYYLSDRRSYYVNCPSCLDEHVLDFDCLVYNKKAYLDNGKDPSYLDTKHKCLKCNHLMTEQEKHKAVRQGRWKASGDSKEIAGFQLSQLYSLFVTWNKSVEEFLIAQSDSSGERMRDFTNLVLGEEYDSGGFNLDWKSFMGLRESYNKIPKDALYLVAGVDVQGDRVEYEIVAFADYGESWGIERGVFRGSKENKDLWDMLNSKLNQSFETEDGEFMKVRCACIDSGHRTSEVYNFCEANIGKNFFPVKGSSQGVNVPIVGLVGRNIPKYRVKLFSVGTHEAKRKVFLHCMRVESVGVWHFPANDNYGVDFFKQLTAERLVKKKTPSGHSKEVWEKLPGRANEALDIRVYCLAAVGIFNFDCRSRLIENLNKPVKSGVFRSAQTIDLG